MSSVRNSSGRDHIFRVGRDLANRSQGRSSVRHLLPGRRIRASRRRGIGQSDPHLFPNNSLIDCSPLLKQAPPDVLNRGNSGQILPADCRRFPTFFPVIREFGWQDGGQNQEPASDPARHRAEPDFTLQCLPQPCARSPNLHGLHQFYERRKVTVLARAVASHGKRYKDKSFNEPPSLIPVSRQAHHSGS